MYFYLFMSYSRFQASLFKYVSSKVGSSLGNSLRLTLQLSDYLFTLTTSEQTQWNNIWTEPNAPSETLSMNPSSERRRLTIQSKMSYSEFHLHYLTCFRSELITWVTVCVSKTQSFICKVEPTWRLVVSFRQRTDGAVVQAHSPPEPNNRWFAMWVFTGRGSNLRPRVRETDVS